MPHRVPFDELQSARFHSYLMSRLRRLSGLVPVSEFVVESVWSLTFDVKLSPTRPGFSDRAVGVAAGALGYCMVPHRGEVDLSECLGKDLRTIVAKDAALRTALLDAGFGAVGATMSARNVDEIVLSGAPSNQGEERARSIGSYLAVGLGISRRLVLVGAVPSLIGALVGHGFSVSAMDYDPELIGGVVEGVTIQWGGDLANSLSDCDVVLATGLVIGTGLVETLIDLKRRFGYRLALYAQSGSRIAPFLCEEGVDIVFAEAFPHYLVGGTSAITVYSA